MSHKLQPGRFTERVEKLRGLIELPEAERAQVIASLPLDKRVVASSIIYLLGVADRQGYEFVGMGAETIVMRRDDVVRKYLWLSKKPRRDTQRMLVDYRLQQRLLGVNSVVPTAMGTERVLGRRMPVQEQPYLDGMTDWRDITPVDRQRLEPALREFVEGARDLTRGTGLLVDVAGQDNLVMCDGALQQVDIGLVRPHEESRASLDYHRSAHRQLAMSATGA